MSEEQDAIGSVAEEAMKLIYALTTTAAEGSGDGGDRGTDHVCNNGWCPLCQIVNHVRDNPEAIERVTNSAANLARSVRDLLEQMAPRPETTRRDVP